VSVLAAVATGLHRGRIELRQNLTSFAGLMPLIWFPAILFAVLFVLRGNAVPTPVSRSAATACGLLGLMLAFHGMIGLASALTVDREDGTLLRARAVPHGVLGHVIGRILGAAGLTAASLMILVVPAAFLFDGLQVGRRRHGWRSWGCSRWGWPRCCRSGPSSGRPCPATRP
jgi:ABC-2 type transport system permease protein